MYRLNLRFSDIQNAEGLLSAVAQRNWRSGNLQMRQWPILIFRIKNPPLFRDGTLLCFETTLFHVRNRYKHVYRYLAHYYFHICSVPSQIRAKIHSRSTSSMGFLPARLCFLTVSAASAQTYRTVVLFSQ